MEYDASRTVASPVHGLRIALQRDADEGTLRPLGDYLALCPQEGEAVARAYLEAVAAVECGESVKLGAREPADDRQAIGPYRLVRELGRGAQGIVWLADDTQLGRKVALKVMHGLGPGPELQRFRREAEVASRLDHPGICAVYDAGVEGDTAWIAMRYVEGLALSRYLAPQNSDGADESARPSSTSVGTGGQEAIRRAVAVVAKCARALHAAHEAGVVHRDIKPTNILVTKDGDPVVVDFGLARADADNLATLTVTGAVFGTPSYMSPEQIGAHHGQVDRRTDVWSLGVCLYEVLCGKKPFDSPTREGLYQAILTREPAALRRVHRTIPRDLSTIAHVCIEKDRNRRYQTAAALAADLEAFLERRPIKVRPLSAAGRVWRWARREKVKAALLAALIIALPTIALLSWNHVLSNRRLVEARRVELQVERDAKLALGYYFLGEHNDAQSLRSFEEALEIDPGLPEAIAGMAYAHVERGRYREALELLTTRGARLAGHRARHLLEADALRGLGETERAAKLEFAAPPPAESVDYFLESRRRYRSGTADAAPATVRLLDQAIRLSPAPRAVHFTALADAAVAADDVATVRDACQALLLHWPTSALSHFVVGSAAGRIGDHDRAIVELREAIRLRPDLGSAHANLGVVLKDLRRVDESIVEFREALRLDPEQSSSYLNLGAALGMTVRIDEAVAVLREGIRRWPDESGLRANLGQVLAAHGRHDEAVSLLQDAVRLAPSNAVARANLADALTRAGDVNGAVDAAREATRLQPDLFEAWNTLGNGLRARGDLDEALVALKEALRLNPGHLAARVNLGSTLHDKGRYDEAIGVLREVIALSPGIPEAHLSLANALKAKGLVRDSLPVYRESIRLGPLVGLTHCNYADALRQCGLIDDAVASFREAVRLSPGFTDAWCGLGVSLREGMRFREAIVAMRRSLEIGMRRPEWQQSVQRLVADCESFLPLEDAFDAAVRGEPLPEDGAALAQVAVMASKRHQPALAIRSFEAAVAHEPGIAGSIESSYRFAAACAAGELACTAAGGGRAWRERARDYLRADLAVIDAKLDAGSISETIAARVLDRWLVAPELASLRDDAALAALAEDERSTWTAFWSSVRERLSDLR